MPGGPSPHYFWHRHYHHMYRRGGFFRRFFWFGLGFGAYAWYSHCKDTNHAYWRHHPIHGDEWRGWSANRWSWPPRERIEQASQQQVEPQAPVQQWGGCRRSHERAQAVANASFPQAMPATVAEPSAAPEPEPVVPIPPQQQSYDWHAERIREAGKAASESVSPSYLLLPL